MARRRKGGIFNSADRAAACRRGWNPPDASVPHRACTGMDLRDAAPEEAAPQAFETLRKSGLDRCTARRMHPGAQPQEGEADVRPCLDRPCGTGTLLSAPYWTKAPPGLSVRRMRSPAKGPPTASMIASKRRSGRRCSSPSAIWPGTSRASRSALRSVRTMPVASALRRQAASSACRQLRIRRP